MRKRWICALIGMMAGWMTAPSVAAVETVWTFVLREGHIPASPAVGDVNGDGRSEIILVTTLGSVIALNGGGDEIWRHELHNQVTIAPTVADLNGDGAVEVLIIDEPGTVHCLRGANGNPVWQASLPGKVLWGETCLAVADLEGDGAYEIVTGDELGSVICLEPDGQVRWTYQGAQGHSLCPAIGDLDGDGLLEITVGGRKQPLVCLSSDGEERWVMGQPVGGSSAVIRDIDEDGVPEIVTGIGNALVVVDEEGQVRWSLPMRRDIDAAITVADANRDEVPEIYAVDLAGHLVCVNPEGSLRWEGEVEERARRSPSVADVDGDGELEILVAGYSGAIHVFSPAGVLKERVDLGGPANATATIVDLAGDGRPCVVCPTEKGTMPALRWPGSRAGAEVAWAEYRGSPMRVGAYRKAGIERRPRIAALDVGECHAGYNQFVAVVENPVERELEVCLEVIRSNGSPSRSVSVSSEKTIHGAVNYALKGTETVMVTFRCLVMEGETVLAEREERRTVRPFCKEMEELEERFVVLARLMKQVPNPAGLEERMHFLAARLPGYRARVMRCSAMPPEEVRALQADLNELSEESTDLVAVLEGIVKVLEEQKGPLVACAANPWAPFGGMKEIGEGRFGGAGIEVEAFAGEVESAALNLFNLSGEERTIRVVIEHLVKDGKEEGIPAKGVVELCEAVAVGTRMYDRSADALPTLNQGNLIVLGPWNARQLWFTIRTDRLTPGKWGTTVRLSSLDVDPTEISANFEMTVWETTLPEEQPLRSCQWGYVKGSVLGDQEEAAVQDQVDHGTNVFVGLYPPKATFDENGEIIGEIDFTEHDAYVGTYAPHGFILFFSYQRGLKGPHGVGSEPYRKAHVAWLQAWVRHLAELGVGYDGFALYPVDEPGLREGLVERNVAYGELAREADPQILLYTDPVAMITVEELEKLAPYVDIWCPNQHLYVHENERDEAKRGELLPFIQSTGKAVWTYACDGNAKHRAPLEYYRGQAWSAWHHGFTGIGFWSYCTSSQDPWFRPKERDDHLLIYQGNGVVTSKRYEAVRDGIEDYSLLWALRRAVEAAQARGADATVIARAERLLGAEASAIAETCRVIAPGQEPNEARGPMLRREADQEWVQIQRVRREMAELWQALE